MQLGLRDMVVNYCLNYGKPSIIPPRMLSIPSSTVRFEERIRAFWITEVLDSTSTLGAAWNVHIPGPEMNVWTPCGDDMWTLPEGLINMLPFGTADAPGSFSMYVRLVSNELWHVHSFLQQPRDLTILEVRLQQQLDCKSVDERLLRWQFEFDNLEKANSSLINSPDAGRDSTVPSANVILIHCTFDAAIIALYQRSTIPSGLDDSSTSFSSHASSRCLQACNHMVSTLRRVADEDIQCMSPQLVACVFVAARFYIINARAVHEDIPPKVDLLKYVLKACGQKWNLARRLGKALNAATMAMDSTLDASLPEEFYDAQYAWPDIDKALEDWAQRS